MKLKSLFLGLVVLFAGVALVKADTVQAKLIGHFDPIGSHSGFYGLFQGWALDANAPQSDVVVHLYMDGPAGKGKLVGWGPASYVRLDVNRVTGYFGDHGYTLYVPGEYRDGANHSVYIYAVGSNGENLLLPGSPKVFNSGPKSKKHAYGTLVNVDGTIYFMNTNTKHPFPSAAVFLSYGYKFSQVVPANNDDRATVVGSVMPMKEVEVNRNPIGNLEEVNQVTATIRGWALDPDSPYSSARYEAYFDGNTNSNAISVTGYAANPRSDVNNVTSYPGNHGFTFSIPESFKDGRVHTVKVYAVDVNTGSKVQLPGYSHSFVLEDPNVFTAEFWSESNSVPAGASAILRWQVLPSLASVTVSGIGPVETSGSRMVTPQSNATYVLTAKYNSQVITKSVAISVNSSSPKLVAFTANRTTVSAFDNQVVLSWTTENATNVVIKANYSNGTHDTYTIQPSGSLTFNLNFTATYTLEASNSKGGAQKSVTVTFQ
jgi:hypothetical protein